MHLRNSACLGVILSAVASMAMAQGWYADGNLYGKRISLEVPAGPAGLPVMVSLPLDALRQADPQFNPQAFKIVLAAAQPDDLLGREIGGNDVPAQLEDRDGDGQADHIVFELPAAGPAGPVYVYYQSGPAVAARYPKYAYAAVGERVFTSGGSRSGRLQTVVPTAGVESRHGMVVVQDSRLSLLAKFGQSPQMERLLGNSPYGLDIRPGPNSQFVAVLTGPVDQSESLGAGSLLMGADAAPMRFGAGKVLASGPVHAIARVLLKADAKTGPTVAMTLESCSDSPLYRVTVAPMPKDARIVLPALNKADSTITPKGAVVGRLPIEYAAMGLVVVGIQPLAGLELAQSGGTVTLAPTAETCSYLVGFAWPGRKTYKTKDLGAGGALKRKEPDWRAGPNIPDINAWADLFDRCAAAWQLPPAKPGKVESAPAPAPPTVPTELVVVNPTDTTTPLPMLVPADLLGNPAGPVSLSAGAMTVALDRLELDGRTMLAGVVPARPLASVPVRLGAAPAPASPFRVSEADGKLKIETASAAWTFGSEGLCEVIDKVRGQAYAVRETLGTEVVLSGPQLKLAGQHVAHVVCPTSAGPRQYLLEAAEARWRIMAPAGYKAIVAGQPAIWVCRFHRAYGAVPAETGPSWERKHKTQRELLWSADWAVCQYDKGGLWISPSPASPRVVVDSAGGQVSVFAETISKRPVLVYDSGWTNPPVMESPARTEITFACVSDPKAGKAAKAKLFPQLLLARRGGNLWTTLLDLDGRGALDLVAVEDRNGDGPDLVADRWLFDMDNEGSLQAIYEFEDQNRDGLCDTMTFYGDGDNFLRDQVLNDVERTFWAVRFHDWTGDGRFFTGAPPFTAGQVDQDWWEARMYVGFSNYFIMPGYASADMTSQIDDRQLHCCGNRCLDLDSDGDWDIQFSNQLITKPANSQHYCMIFDYDDVDGPIGVLLDPTTGFFFPKETWQYAMEKGNMMCFWEGANFVRTGQYADSIWGTNDAPQGSLDLDGKPGPEARWYSRNALTDDDKLRTQVVRWAMDMDGDCLGITDSVYSDLEPFGWDFCIHPGTFVTSQGFNRMPHFPIQTPRWTDPHGNTISMLGHYVPTHWDGKRLGVFRRDGKPAEWVRAWDWTMETRWDQVGIVFGDYSHGPESYQTVDPPQGESRFECDLKGKIDYFFYHDPLDGYFHFRGTQWGFRTHNPSPMSRQDKARVNDLRRRFLTDPSPRFPKSNLWYYYGWNCEQWTKDIDYNRACFLRYEACRDTDGDGYMDAYLYDADNDGQFDKRLFARPDGSLLLIQGDRSAALVTTLKRQGEVLRPENYGRLQALYRPLKKSENGLIHAMDLSKHEAPLPAGVDWASQAPALPVAVFDVAATTAETTLHNLFWEGHSRLWSAVSFLPVLTRTAMPADPSAVRLYVIGSANGQVSVGRMDKVLAGGGTVLVTELSPSSPKALRDWLAGHGIRPGQPRAFADKQDEQLQHLDTPETMQNKHFTTEVPALLAGIKKLYFEGHALEAPGAKVLLAFDGAALGVMKDAGPGRLVVFGPADLLNNTWASFGHPLCTPPSLGQGANVLTWLQPRNNDFIDNLVGFLLGKTPAGLPVGELDSRLEASGVNEARSAVSPRLPTDALPMRPSARHIRAQVR